MCSSDLDFLRNINERHVSQQNKSSLYTLFPTYENGNEKYTFATFEHLMSQDCKFEFKQDNTAGSRTTTESDQMNNLLWVNVPQSFDTGPRHLTETNRFTYNLNTGVPQNKDGKKQEFKRPVGTQEINFQQQPDRKSTRLNSSH